MMTYHDNMKGGCILIQMLSASRDWTVPMTKCMMAAAQLKSTKKVQPSLSWTELQGSCPAVAGNSSKPQATLQPCNLMRMFKCRSGRHKHRDAHRAGIQGGPAGVPSCALHGHTQRLEPLSQHCTVSAHDSGCRGLLSARFPSCKACKDHAAVLPW